MSSQPRPAGFVVVDDHAVVREGVIRLLQAEGLVCLGEASDPESGLALIERKLPQLAIVDLSMSDGDGLQLVRAAAARRLGTRILVLSVMDEAHHAVRALRAGAAGYVMKEKAADTLLEAARRVLRSETYLSPKAASSVVESLSPRRSEGGLSEREREVFRLIGEGLTTRQIAAALGVRPKTVAAHRENIKKKLGLRTAAELSRAAFLSARIP